MRNMTISDLSHICIIVLNCLIIFKPVSTDTVDDAKKSVECTSSNQCHQLRDGSLKENATLNSCGKIQRDSTNPNTPKICVLMNIQDTDISLKGIYTSPPDLTKDMKDNVKCIKITTEKEKYDEDKHCVYMCKTIEKDGWIGHTGLNKKYKYYNVEPYLCEYFNPLKRYRCACAALTKPIGILN